MRNALPQRKKLIPERGRVRPGEMLTYKQLWVLLLFILAITFVAFLPSLSNGFVFWDDPGYVYENQSLKEFNFFKVFSFGSYYMMNYHPLTLLWLHLEWLAFPKGDPSLYNGFNPFWFHLNNLLFHLLNTTLVFFVIYELINKKSWKTAGITALLFGIHPMHVESVAWISETKDVLYTAFLLGSAWFYLHYLKTIKFKLLVVSFGLFLLSCFAKGQAVVLPLLFLLFDFYQGRKFDKRSVLEKVPFFAASLFFGYLSIKAQASGSSINMTQFSSFSNIFFGFYGLLIYMLKLFLPIHLSGFHPYPIYPSQPLPVYFYGIPLIIIALLFVLYRTLRYSKDWLFGFLFFLFAISVTLRFIPVGDNILAERYTYIPYIGLFFTGGQLYTKYSGMKKWKNVVRSILVIITVVLVVMTWQRTQVWKNSYTFWGDVAGKYPNCWRSYTCLGREYSNAGNQDKAHEYFNLAIARDQWAYPEAYLSRGAFYLEKMHNPDSAIADFRKVMSYPFKNDISQMWARIYLGMALNEKGDFKNADAIIDEAIRRDPGRAISYFLKGIASTGLQKYRQADSAYSTAIKISPGYLEAYLQRGILYTDNLGEYDKGIADFRKILRLQPGHKDATINIGICLYRMDRVNEAIDIFSRAIQLYPDDGKLYYLRSLAFVRSGNFQQALEDGVKAKQLGYALSDDQLSEWQKKAKTY